MSGGQSPSGLSLPVTDQAPLRGSVDSDDPKVLWDALGGLRKNVLSVVYRLQQNDATPLHLSAVSQVACPIAGILSLYATSRVAIAVNATNYWTLTGIRQGQAESSVLVKTNNTPIIAYQEFFLGQFNVGQSDVMGVRLTATLAPAALTESDITLRCELKPRIAANT